MDKEVKNVAINIGASPDQLQRGSHISNNKIEEGRK